MKDLIKNVNTPIGGSAKPFSLPNIKLYISSIVLHEIEKNVRKKLEDYHLDRFFMLASKLEIISNEPNDLLIKQAKKVIVEKDAVILAEAKGSSCSYIITLDKKDFLQDRANKFVKPKKILTPKMFFEMIK